MSLRHRQPITVFWTATAIAIVFLGLSVSVWNSGSGIAALVVAALLGVAAGAAVFVAGRVVFVLTRR